MTNERLEPKGDKESQARIFLKRCEMILNQSRTKAQGTRHKLH